MESEITKKIFEERLDALVECHSVKIKLLGTRSVSPYQNQIKILIAKNSIIDEFAALKSSFFAEVNLFKNKYLNSYSNGVSINNSERLIKQLQDNINFLRQQSKNKDEMINSLLQQLSKCHGIVVHCNYKKKFIKFKRNSP